MNLTPKRKSKGSIVIAALAVMAITASIATMLLMTQAIEIKKTQLLMTQDKLFGYAQGVEAWAIGLLRETARDREKNQVYDDLTQTWAQPMPTTMIDDVEVSGRIIDLQGSFNVNTLLFDENEKLPPGSEAEAKKIPEDYFPAKVFERLANQLPAAIEEGLPAEIITHYIVEWVGEGAANSDEEYTQQDAGYAYRPSKRNLLSVSELRLIKGITAHLMQQLLNVVSAVPFLPGAEDDSETLTKININTTSPIVLGAILNTSPEKAIELIEARPYISMQEVTQAISKLEIKGASGKIVSAWLDVKSEYFLVESKARIGSYEATWYSVVYRSTENEVEILYRMRGVY